MHLAQCISVRSLRIGSICNYLFNKYDLQEKGKKFQAFISYRIITEKAKVSLSNSRIAVLSQTELALNLNTKSEQVQFKCAFP